MPELVRRGHIYIAQPPLFKVTQGKNIIYLKDEGALAAYLVSNAVDGAGLAPGEGAPPISGVALESLMTRFDAATKHLDRMAQRFDRGLLEAMIDLAPVTAETFSDSAALHSWAQSLAKRLEKGSLDAPRYVINVIGENDDESVVSSTPQGRAISLTRRHHGLSSIQTLTLPFFLSTDYRPIGDLAKDLFGLIQAGAMAMRGGRSEPVDSFKTAFTWLLEQAQRNREIGRFKGLGEMNADQLWDTTVNPDTRRLLHVRIEDAIAADQMFGMLMGEEVEPRRVFIEENALKVANLDV